MSIPNMRPGVYVEHTITRLYSQYNTRGIGLIAQGVDIGLKRITNYTHAQSIYPQNSEILHMINVVFDHIACEIYVITLPDQTIASYADALEQLLSKKELYCIVSDWENPEFIASAVEKIVSTNKLFFSGCSSQPDPISLANAINNERICLTAPSITSKNAHLDISPLLMAILVLNGENLSSNLAGQALIGQYQHAELSEDVKNSYLYNGINVFETSNEQLTLIRGVTTRTRNPDGEIDFVYRNICIITAIDSVKTSLTESLSRRLNATNPIASSGAILTLVVNELVNLKDTGIISSYERPIISVKPEDSSSCEISVNVTINQGINQIYLQLNMNI